MLGLYERTLLLSLRHRFTTIVAAALMIALTTGLIVIVPKGFIPTCDNRTISCNPKSRRTFPSQL